MLQYISRCLFVNEIHGSSGYGRAHEAYYDSLHYKGCSDHKISGAYELHYLVFTLPEGRRHGYGIADKKNGNSHKDYYYGSAHYAYHSVHTAHEAA